jgi:hypothetical protein
VEFLKFSLHVERKVARDFGESPSQEAVSCGDFGDTIAMRVPGDFGKRKAKIFGEKSGNFLTTVAERSECADGTTKLKDERSATQGE